MMNKKKLSERMLKVMDAVIVIDARLVKIEHQMKELTSKPLPKHPVIEEIECPFVTKKELEKELNEVRRVIKNISENGVI